MRHNTVNRYNYDLKRYIRVTTLYLSCGHKVEYFGGPDDMEAAMLSHGVTVSITNISRCLECSRRFAALLADISAGFQKERTVG